jgi:hypothetical protein
MLKKTGFSMSCACNFEPRTILLLKFFLSWIHRRRPSLDDRSAWCPHPSGGGGGMLFAKSTPQCGSSAEYECDYFGSVVRSQAGEYLRKSFEEYLQDQTSGRSW